MKKSIAKKWVKALRSGEYKQGFGKLNLSGRFCCLGVLCELAVKSGVDVPVTHEGPAKVYAFNSDTLPQVVMEWAGMKSQDGTYRTDTNCLAEMNDSGRSFDYLANIIERNVEKL
jgi:hypothetical protein